MKDKPEPRPRLATQHLGEPHTDIKLGYVEWGAKDARQVVICVHGLTRNARDFDTLAEVIATRGVRVIAVDIVGRGRSSWLKDPNSYQIPSYVSHISTFLTALGLTQVDWVGTSMGGLIGMGLAALERNPIRRLILNDVGPFVPEAALQQIQTYLGLDLFFASLDDLEAHLRVIHAGFGELSDAQWRHLAVHSARQTPEGLRLHYDPDIRVPYEKLAAGDLDMWEVWDKIRCPTYVLHGADSPILSQDTVEKMQQRGSRATVERISGVGHAPALMSPDQVQTVGRWLGLSA